MEDIGYNLPKSFMESVLMVREVVTGILALMLVIGALMRYREMTSTIMRLSRGDQIREWAGYLSLIVLCVFNIGVFWLSGEVTVGIIAFGVMVFYIQTARQQFPIFK